LYSKSKGEIKKSMVNEADPLRIKALNTVTAAMQLVDENNFPKVKAAVMAKDKEVGKRDFVKLCRSKGISVSTANAIWKALTEREGRGTIWP
jgi:hypothetical protein